MKTIRADLEMHTAMALSGSPNNCKDDGFSIKQQATVIHFFFFTAKKCRQLERSPDSVKTR